MGEFLIATLCRLLAKYLMVLQRSANNTPIVENEFSYAISGSCCYVNGRIDTCKGKILIDTGSSISVVATQVH